MRIAIGQQPAECVEVVIAGFVLAQVRMVGQRREHANGGVAVAALQVHARRQQPRFESRLGRGIASHERFQFTRRRAALLGLVQKALGLGAEHPLVSLA